MGKLPGKWEGEQQQSGCNITGGFVLMGMLVGMLVLGTSICSAADLDTFKQGTVVPFGDNTVRVLSTNQFAQSIIAFDWCISPDDPDGLVDVGSALKAFQLSGERYDPKTTCAQFSEIGYCPNQKSSEIVDADQGADVRWSKNGLKGIISIPGTRLVLVVDMRGGLRMLNASNGGVRTIVPLHGTGHSVTVDRERDPTQADGWSLTVHIYLSMYKGTKTFSGCSDFESCIIGWKDVLVSELTFDRSDQVPITFFFLIDGTNYTQAPTTIFRVNRFEKNLRGSGSKNGGGIQMLGLAVDPPTGNIHGGCSEGLFVLDGFRGSSVGSEGYTGTEWDSKSFVNGTYI
jgi:hypothetical protein